jgi:hypothetical protein
MACGMVSGNCRDFRDHFGMDKKYKGHGSKVWSTYSRMHAKFKFAKNPKRKRTQPVKYENDLENAWKIWLPKKYRNDAEVCYLLEMLMKYKYCFYFFSRANSCMLDKTRLICQRNARLERGQGYIGQKLDINGYNKFRFMY